jgi:hypothetical protein
MLNSTTTAFANMPTEVVFKPFPNPYSPMDINYNDTLAGIDGQIGGDIAKRNSGIKPRKV